MCAEGFSALIENYEQLGKIRGCKVAKGAPIISHMLFTDDSYICCKASEEGARNFMELLQLFERASGQQVNLNKSSTFFSKNTGGQDRNRVCSILGVKEAGDDYTYLGLPNIIGRNNAIILGFLKERMRKCIKSWESRFLSKAGKELMLKSVAQALPSYTMNVFLLLGELCKDMEQMMCNYWWKSNSNSNKGIHWKSWDKLTVHKSKGRRGFRSLREFNLALLGKQAWRLMCTPDSLVGRVFKARYIANTDFLSAKLGSSPSFIWRSILQSQDLVRSDSRRRIGNGAEVSIINYPWLPCNDNPRVTSCNTALDNHNVDSLMETENLAWDVDLVRDLFNEWDANLILSITLNSGRNKDVWF